MKKFYTIEGTEGSGKSTTIKIVSRLLSEAGFDNVITREPGGTGIKTSELIREVILRDEMESITGLTEFLLYLASRKEHIDKLISPQIQEGNIVISDRYNDSSLAYQGYAKEGNIESMKDLSKNVIGDFVPNKTFFIDIDPEEGIRRIMSNRTDETNRFDYLDMDFHKKVHKGYLSLADENPKRYVIIDGKKTPEEIANKIAGVIINEEK